MNARKVFLILTLVMIGITGVCGGLPHALFYAHHGRLPLRKSQNPFDIPPGATADEVQSRLGPPHDRLERPDGEECWYYYGDVFGFAIWSIYFDATGRLRSVGLS